ncbi:MAG: tetratricopeptide repeat protein [Spirochaetaceae bacterium]|nr:MAG: tetratricopeptide repeat protein [Spirochaetaceae bacterium]
MKKAFLLAEWIVVLILAVVGVVFVPAAWSQEVRLQTAPRFLVPIADHDVYGLGVGGSLALAAYLTNFFAPVAGVQVVSIRPAASGLDSSLLLAAGSAGVEFFAYPTARLRVAGSLAAGAYVGSYRRGTDTIPTGNVFWQAGADAGYRLSPRLTLAGGASYIDLRRRTDSLYRGVAIYLLAEIGLDVGSFDGRAVLDAATTVPVYPVLADRYRRDAFGVATIRNGESAEIRNVQVWFSAPGYTSGPILCGTIAYLARGARAEFPLYAGFSDTVMTVTELLRTAGEVRIDYELLGEPRSVRADTTIAIRHRNAFTWDDPRILASFVSTNDQALLDLSKYVAGVVRSATRTEIDSNMQYALALFEGLRLAGLAWSPDPQTPYAAMRGTSAEEDYVQYPHQTLAYAGGDSDDLAVLYAAAIESVGVPAALIPLPDDVVVAAQLGLSETAARAFFSDPDQILFVDGEAWLPVSPTFLREGFLRAWSEGARLVRETPGAVGEFFRLADARRAFPSVGVPGVAIGRRRPNETEVVRAFTNLVALIVEREVAPKADRIRRAFGPDGGTGRQRNTLGILYGRYGVYDMALVEFQAAVAAGYDRAVVNIGNIAFLLGDYQTALSWYLRAAQLTPDEPAAIIGLARTYYELDLYEQADRYFDLAKELVPEFAVTYSYLAARIGATEGRASAAMDRLGNVLWDE